MAARTRTDLESLDQSDSLAAFRDEFFLPEGVIYLNGNSLGAMPLAAAVGMGGTVAICLHKSASPHSGGTDRPSSQKEVGS